MKRKNVRTYKRKNTIHLIINEETICPYIVLHDFLFGSGLSSQSIWVGEDVDGVSVRAECQGGWA